MPACNGWYHCMANTYGTWLPGDPRGFRTRHHREHVEGDYKHPPSAGIYEKRHQHARDRMKRPPVHLCANARAAARDAILHALIEVHQVEVLALAVGGQHLHVLARFGVFKKPTASGRGLPENTTYSHADLRHTDPARYFLGIAKERSAKHLAELGLVLPGGVWARRGKVVPIEDRKHHTAVVNYIAGHRAEGAAVWTFLDGWPMGEKKPTA